MTIDPVIFREYDLRGIYPTNVNEEMAYVLGQSMGTCAHNLGSNEVIVGYDNRLSSVPLAKSLIKGIISTGVNVINLGLVTTPMFYFARHHLNKWTAMMITASHNPGEYNGFKISFNDKGNAAGKEIYDFRDFTFKGEFISNEPGTVTDYSIKEAYLEEIKKSLDFKDRKIKVVVDTMNGTGAVYIKEIMEQLPLEYELLYDISDGTFPNNHPDPSVPSNLVDLQKKVVELKYDLGFAVDADADRVSVINEKGEIIATDIYMAIMYRYLNHNLKNRTALFDVKCSRALIDELDKLNIDKCMYRTGNSYVFRKVREDNLDFGGELSGHIFFNDKWPGIDDGIYAGLRMCELLSNIDTPLSSLTTGLNKYYSTPEIKIELTDTTKFVVLDKVKAYLDSHDYKYNNTDGVRVEFNDGWGLIRVSNTGPHLTLRFEATTEEKLKTIQEELTTILNKMIESVV